MALRFAGLGSVVERSATKAAIAQALESLACPHSVCGGRGAVGGGTVTSSALRGRKLRLCKGVRAGSSRENLRFSSWMSDQYYEG